MAKADYVIQGGYYYDNLADAVKNASVRAVRNGEELKVYKAVKLVAPKTPDVDVSDILLTV